MSVRYATYWGMAFALAATVVAGCGHAESAASAADAPAERAGDGTIAVDDKMLQSIKIDQVTEHEIPHVLSAPGTVQFDEDRVARVLAPLAGQVIDLHVKVGDPVAKSAPLCIISSRDAAAAVGEHIESHKDLELAEKTATMTQDLFDHQAASKIALDQAQNDLAKARSRVERSEQALRALGFGGQEDFARIDGRVPVLSPLGGVVIERKVTQGQFVQADSDPIMVVADLSSVWVVGDVFERDLREVALGQSALITAAAYPGEQFQGRVSYISDVIDPATRAAKVRVAVTNPNRRLKPEMFASIVLDIADRQRAPTVPARALFVEDGKTYVYVQLDGRRFARRAVEVGQDGADRRVLSGLQTGDKVVVEGALLLRQQEDKRAG